MRTPTQREVKTLLRDVVSHGAHAQIAKQLGITEGAISRRFNPEDDLKCGIGEALRELCALKHADPKAFQVVRAFFDSHLDSDCGEASADLPQLVGDVAKESADVICAEVQRKPMHIRRKEAHEAEGALRRYRISLAGQQLRKVG